MSLHPDQTPDADTASIDRERGKRAEEGHGSPTRPHDFSLPGAGGAGEAVAIPAGPVEALGEVDRVKAQVSALLGATGVNTMFGRPGGVRVIHSSDLASMNLGAATFSREDREVRTPTEPSFEPLMGVRVLAGLQDASTDLEHILAEQLATNARAIEAIGAIHDCAILRHESQLRWQMVLRDASTAGNWRTQGFDGGGFFGHMTFATKEEAIERAVETGYTVRDDEALDRVQDTAAFQRGLYCSELTRLTNAGEITYEQAIKKINDYDESRAALTQVGNATAQAFYSSESGEIVLIADRIAPGKEQAVFLHEVMHKHGMTRLGPRVMARLVDQVGAWSNEAPESSERKIHDGAARRAARAAAPGTALFSEEFFAYAVEEAVGLGVRPQIDARAGSAESWLADVVSTIQGVVYDLTHGASRALDAQRLVDLAYALAQLEHPSRGEEIRMALGEKLLSDVCSRLAVVAPFDPTATPGFKIWSRGLPVVELGEVDNFESGCGVIVEALHGTAGEFERFSLSCSNFECDLGAGIYGTNSASDASGNYAGVERDMTRKLVAIEERIEAEAWDLGEEPPSGDDLRDMAKQELGVSHEGMILPIYMRLENPAVLGGLGETELAYEFDEELGAFVGRLARFIEHIHDSTRGADPLLAQTEAEELEARIVQAVLDAGNDALRASELKEVFANGAVIEHPDGIANQELFRSGLACLGYDGIIDLTVNAKFGARAGRPGMKGMARDTAHFIVFDPSQVASRIGSTWRREAHAHDILKSLADDEIPTVDEVPHAPRQRA